MPDETPEPCPEEDAAPAAGEPRFAWVPGCVDSGLAPEPGSADDASGGVLPPGLDYQVLLEALADSGLLAGNEDDQDAVLAEELDAAAEGRMQPVEPGRLAALAAEHMIPGPEQAGWLGVATAAARGLDEDALAGVAIAARQLASWAQAGELSACAQISARAAAADPKIGLEADGRPARLCRDALGQISLALMLTDHSAGSWTDLAVTLAWRLHATGKALAAGVIDLDRARVIAEATSMLPEHVARAVEGKVLPGAGRRTKAQLRERLRHLVIAADPEGAERRRQDAEQHADVRLYGGDDQTATIVADKQPQIEAAAGYARITAMARARKAAGLPGTLGQHRSQVLLGLLLGTLPPIPPAHGAPPDQPSPGDHDPGEPGPGGGSRDGEPGHGPSGGPGHNTDPGREGHPSRPGGQAGPGPDDGVWDDPPAPQDEDAPDDDGLDDALADRDEEGRSWDPAEEDDDLSGTGPAQVWPALGAIPPALAGPAPPADGRPVPGLLDVTLPWTTLAGQSDTPGTLGRIGPITAAQARQLAHAAGHDPATQWRIIVTSPTGQAITVTRIRRRVRDGPARDGPAAPRDGPPPGAGLVGRLTLTISQDAITTTQPQDSRPGSPGQITPAGITRARITAAALRAANRALERATARAAADQEAGGCAHAEESAAYRPPPRLREQVIARDVTCRNPICRQPAWRADLDHTHPYDQHGRTCTCNLGGGCRRHHQLKQHPRWELQQTRPGEFTWTTPTGRTYSKGPDTYLA